MIDVPYAKFDAVGNTWIVVSNDDLKPAPSRHGRVTTAWLGGLARAICRRRHGIDADGLALILSPESAGNLTRVRFFNADGSEAEMSGNGIRCAAAWLGSKHVKARRWRIETAAGLRIVSIRTDSVGPARKKPRGSTQPYVVRMGKPILDPASIPFRSGGKRAPLTSFPLQTSQGRIPVTVTSMGNPHCSIFVNDFSAVKWKRLGREIEMHRLFPNRTNVEFVKILSRREIEVRFWERGVGQTLSSGTGSCAAVVACVLGGHTGRKVRVRTQAGNLDVAWQEGSEVLLAGPVKLLRQGSYRYRGQLNVTPGPAGL